LQTRRLLSSCVLLLRVVGLGSFTSPLVVVPD